MSETPTPTPECEHEWHCHPATETIYPPKQRRICEHCGKRETVVGTVFVTENRYDAINQQFHGGGNG
jgi:hypothetical protein